MITLHRLGRDGHELHINPDLIVSIEANPDTVITLANGSKLVVSEAPSEVAAEVRDYRVDIMAGALRLRRDPQPPREVPAEPQPLREAASVTLHLAPEVPAG